MFGLEAADGPAGAAITVGVVFAEAILLYVGYGALSSVVGSALRDALGGD